jgi:hypothetical protein
MGRRYPVPANEERRELVGAAYNLLRIAKLCPSG